MITHCTTSVRMCVNVGASVFSSFSLSGVVGGEGRRKADDRAAVADLRRRVVGVATYLFLARTQTHTHTLTRSSLTLSLSFSRGAVS